MMDTRSEIASTAMDGDAPECVDAVSRACGVIAMLGVAVFTIICIAAQFLRPDLDWLTTAMSIYVKGPFGGWVQAAFFAPVPALAAMGIAWHRTLNQPSRSAASLALFAVAAVALCFTAAFVTDLTPTPTTLHGEIHQWAAFGTFVCATTGMTLQSWLLRWDAHWRKHFISAFTVAAVAIVYFWVFALVKPIARGIGEKVVIGLVLLWIWRAAWWLVRDNLHPLQPARRTRP